MQYLIMIAIVLGLAIVDFIFGIMKGYVTHSLSSQKMRQGGINKLCEIIIMSTACGLEIAIQALGEYYAGDTGASFAEITGVIAAILVCGYISIMEVISILENYAEINPNALWVKRILKRLKVVDDENSSKKEEKNE